MLQWINPRHQHVRLFIRSSFHSMLWIFVYIAEIKTIFSMSLPLLDPINTFWGEKNLYFGGCKNSWWILWAKNQLHTPLHSKIMLAHVEYIFWCLLYMLIYSHVLIFTAVSPILHNWPSPLFCLCQQQKQINMCTLVKLGHIWSLLIQCWLWWCVGQDDSDRHKVFWCSDEDIWWLYQRWVNEAANRLINVATLTIDNICW